jgi:hypothetical protein
MAPSPLDELFTTFEAAKILRISVATVQRYFDCGKLTGTINPITGRRKIYFSSMLRLAEEHGCTLKKKGGDDPREYVLICTGRTSVF